MMKFEPLLPKNYTALTPFFQNQSYQLCTYSLPSLIVWRTHVFHPRMAVIDGRLFILADFPKDKKRNHLILPIPSHNDVSPSVLYEIASAAGISSFWFVPETYFEKYPFEKTDPFFSVREQPEFEDYIYRKEDLAELKGNTYSKKRNLINQFKRDYVRKKRVRTASLLPEDADECLEFLEEWCLANDCDAKPEEDLACEKLAAINAINEGHKIGMNGLILRIDGKINAFAIASPLTVDMGVLHFEKAFADVKGLYQYFDQQCARRLFPGVKYINKESDMGIPGLAQAKKSYFPVMREKAFRLELK